MGSALANIDESSLEQETKRMLQHTVQAFRRAGIHKDDDTRNKIKAIQDELVKLGQEFADNIREDKSSIELDTTKDLKGLPEYYIKNYKPKNNKINVPVTSSAYTAFMKYAESEQVRKNFPYVYVPKLR